MFINTKLVTNNRVGMSYNQSSRQAPPPPAPAQVVLNPSTRSASVPMVMNQPQKKGCRSCGS